jgi:hypothetical protein
MFGGSGYARFTFGALKLGAVIGALLGVRTDGETGADSGAKVLVTSRNVGGKLIRGDLPELKQVLLVTRVAGPSDGIALWDDGKAAVRRFEAVKTGPDYSVMHTSGDEQAERRCTCTTRSSGSTPPARPRLHDDDIYWCTVPAG